MTVVFGLTLVAALGCGLIAGVFFAFSAFVMRGLAGLPPAQGIAAMQSINRTAVRPLFMAALFGTALVCLGLAVWAVLAWGELAAAWVLVGAGLYLIGAIVVTAVRNVPLNDALAAIDPAAASSRPGPSQGADPDAADHWRRYLAHWTAWNHVRVVAALAAAAMFTVALVQAY